MPGATGLHRGCLEREGRGYKGGLECGGGAGLHKGAGLEHDGVNVWAGLRLLEVIRAVS